MGVPLALTTGGLEPYVQERPTRGITVLVPGEFTTMADRRMR